jgi:hypothetical protein
VEGYSVTEAASVLGVPTERVWELLARGILSGAPDGETGMRVFLQPRPAPAPIEEPRRGNGHDTPREREAEASPFRELLTEFRNLTERYGQALLALGEARGEVASLRTRVDLLEARMDLRLPMSGWNAPQPPSTAPRPAESQAALAAEVGEHEPEGEGEREQPARRRRARGQRRATDDFAEALARAEDPSPAVLPESLAAAAAVALPEATTTVEEAPSPQTVELAEADLPREMPFAEPIEPSEPIEAAEVAAAPKAEAELPDAAVAVAKVVPPDVLETPVAGSAASEPIEPAAPEITEPFEAAAPEPAAPHAAEPAETATAPVEMAAAATAAEPSLEAAPEADLVPPAAIGDEFAEEVASEPEPEWPAMAAELRPEADLRAETSPPTPEPSPELVSPAVAVEPRFEPEPVAAAPEPEVAVDQGAEPAWDRERYSAQIEAPDWWTPEEDAWPRDEPAAAARADDAQEADAPDAAEPKATEPTAVEPDAVEPEALEPEAVEQHAVEAETSTTDEGVTSRTPPEAESLAGDVAADSAAAPSAGEDVLAPTDERMKRAVGHTRAGEETMLWIGAQPEPAAPPAPYEDAASEIEVASTGHRGAHMDDALDALDALARRGSMQAPQQQPAWPVRDDTRRDEEREVGSAAEGPRPSPTSPVDTPHEASPATRAYQRLRRIFPG